jgi:hypothetical protein
LRRRFGCEWRVEGGFWVDANLRAAIINRGGRTFKVSSRHDWAMMLSMKDKHVKIPISGFGGMGGGQPRAVHPYGPVGSCVVPLNLPLSAVFQFGSLRSLGNFGYAAIITLLNAALLFCIMFLFLKRKKKVRNK